MNLRNVIIIVIVLFAALFLASWAIAPSSGCYSIGSCKECWRWYSVPRACEGNESCYTDPSIEQHNALVDVISCACGEAKSKNYADAVLNSEIEKLYSSVMSGYSGTVNEICEGRVPLSKWKY